jgi:hypothetical protein
MAIMLHLNKRKGTTLFAASLAAGLSLCAQTAKPSAATGKAEPSGAVFRADTRVVDLHATVVDKSGHLVTNLPREAFTVYENGVQREHAGQAVQSGGRRIDAGEGFQPAGRGFRREFQRRSL